MNAYTTKIIAGKYKGKQLELPSLDVTRSSKSRLKESFFNVLQFDIIDTTFIEAFAGSGSIGLEAISRDSKDVFFIERDKTSYNVLIRNCKNVDMSKCHLNLGDTFAVFPTLMESLKNRSNELVIYIDPPFDSRDGMDDIYTKCFEMISKIENDNVLLICFEHVTTLEMPESLGKFQLSKSKKFGKSTLSYYKVQ
ncbi:MAG: 16S rRNA (guanine(966)-N(2))-methyltransferase RsmD [Campylobacteraceae bacterium]|nr:16S rRNA (guanine(966)-N(2))-methyltransferase RsmD [Campylobacteraceae bacterium]